MSEFMGKNGFQWFVGVVEDRKDPQTLGRLRVRCLGYHTEGLDKLPTSDLPWAHVMNPITSATVSGIGQTPLGAVEGTWVVGFFQDGSDAQQPIIIGTLPGKPTELPDTGAKKGFMDAVNGAYPKYKDETDVNRLAVNSKSEVPNNPRAAVTETNPHSSLTIRRADRTRNIGRADFNEVELGRAIIGTPITLKGDDGTAFDEPAVPYNSKYPYNHVHETESGHIRELDDSPGSERIHERHKSGTGYEIHPDGSKVTRVKKDNYTLTSGDDYTHIKGTSRHTTDEGVRIRVNANGEEGNNYNIEVGAGSNVNVEVNKGNINLTTLSPDEGDININAAHDLNIQVNRNLKIGVLGDVDIDVKGQWTETTRDKTEVTTLHYMEAKSQTIIGNSEVDIDGARIDLN